MQSFQKIDSKDSIQAVIKAAFDADFDIEGGWGYSPNDMTIIHHSDAIKEQEHTLTSMRAYLEMNMTLSEEERYGSINIREKLRKSSTNVDEVTYEISAMKESDYNRFINEYKKGYGTADFNMSEHFQQRKEATLLREVKHYFKLI